MSILPGKSRQTSDFEISHVKVYLYDTYDTTYRPWELVSEPGQREGDGVEVLGLGFCRGLMEEFKLLRMAFGAAELVRE